MRHSLTAIHYTLVLFHDAQRHDAKRLLGGVCFTYGDWESKGAPKA
jgi:hypothetical protein